MRIRCPCCHAEYSIEQAVEDEAARELMGVLADQPREVSRPLAAYLGLFRARTRALAWERALRLAREVLALAEDARALGQALSETVEAMRAKQSQSDWRPLANHNYLKRVLEGVEVRPQSTGAAAPAPNGQNAGSAAPSSRTAQALQELEDWRQAADEAGELPAWFREVVGEGLQRLIAIGLPGGPGYDAIRHTAQAWAEALWSAPVDWDEGIDRPRLESAFSRAGRGERWVTPEQFKRLMPSRPQQRAAPRQPLSEEERERNRARLDEMIQQIGGRRP